MRAQPGDRIVLAAPHTSQSTRDGVVREVRGLDGEPPYVVEWSDGHQGLFYPGPGAMLRVTSSMAAASETPPPTSETSEVVPPRTSRPPRVRDWHVRVSIFEQDDDTDAHVVLLSDSPQHLSAQGHSHRSSRTCRLRKSGTRSRWPGHSAISPTCSCTPLSRTSKE
jgi:Domain of unknown function (DUF1918)/Rv2632c-like